MSTYNEHLEFLKQQELGAIAELHGFISAQHRNACLPYSTSTYAQQRFMHGYEDGKAILEVERMERETNP